ncbi:hypothetical protein H6G74_28895 [Nostoc spongiaeforme FACHB-130]|uniref:Uncharacterized protein n=1 Tax=Nostoc spongiaeforme FACHB-130 TaxID=1357510 RepID=A0ABR8G588_9NOSO|nr:hypothetical protein [Nostoc spongiaeforme]MBD2598314.1 hypothetical protein [Nostoc spongiaeforme FACHB-130]
MPRLFINYVICNQRSESSGSEDEIYLKINGKKVWPDGNYENIKQGQRLDINYSEDIRGDVTVELWEYDDISPDDLLGSVTANEYTLGTHTGHGNGDGGRYEINYEVR